MDSGETDHFDLLIIGGGINGAGIARDAAGRGLAVCLVEKDDLASHTSSASTKLVHGGLRYLEHYEFRLVRESLRERERLLAIAPHIIWPLRFVLPHDEGLRPKWMLRLGLFLYDHLGGRKLLAPTRSVDLRKPPHGAILEQRLTRGFEYSDCWVEDSRLVVLNCMDAAARGASIRTRTECIALERGADRWTARLAHGGAESTVTADRVVNAAGPWIDRLLDRALPQEGHAKLRLVKGSHLIFPRLFEGEHCYIFQNRDGRIIFAIPYERDFTLIGTTDVSFEGDPAEIAISAEEARYLCDAANEYLARDVSPDDAVGSYAGVRPLYDDRSAENSTVTRDYQFELDRGETGGGPPLLSIFGGKITTYRKLAEHALKELGIGGREWTARAALPGGDIDPARFEDFVSEQARRHPFLAPATVRRLARAYGTRMDAVIGDARGTNDLGQRMGGDLYAAELEYLVAHEFARSAEDVLKRRSKLFLHLDPAAQERVARWFEQRG
ncbi:glycerol-3-phosphate dehydrogenase [Erythrobacter sp. HL-111]|uniref:glycerol-3-phosphate dehydrogenase n=1 Tax=Erythrobacter sp. HL-111 TaxID=1798193 RepID=UPI0006D9CCB2|nr:glycerol-3-phosphate dehydrogenase [Erythrobacter sp. HL-111]KPP83595.1 MAG: anaerobic glycerol-3-phosphate dehydrogenase subunit GlpA [Erythrobacteraceae bacterium HL-111]SDS29768.1 homodimeric glycerol 3-phosphate dehydrogenase (quinone) [Erythrobacter sp. HL-111]